MSGFVPAFETHNLIEFDEISNEPTKSSGHSLVSAPLFEDNRLVFSCQQVRQSQGTLKWSQQPDKGGYR